MIQNEWSIYSLKTVSIRYLSMYIVYE